MKSYIFDFLKVKRWLKFVFGGAINTAISYGFYLLAHLVLSYQIAYLIAYVSGIIFSYLFNAIIVFKTDLNWKSFCSYPLVYIIQYGASASLLGMLVRFVHVNSIWAPLLVAISMIPITYVMSKLILERAHRPRFLDKNL